MSATQGTESKAVFVIVGGLDVADDRIEISVGPKSAGDPELTEWRQCLAEWKAAQPSESETVAKFRAEVDRLNAMLSRTAIAADRAGSLSDEVVKLRQMLTAARNTISDLQQARAELSGRHATAREALERRTAERDAANERADALQAEPDAAFRRGPDVGGWVIVTRRNDESIEDALRKSLSDIASNAPPR